MTIKNLNGEDINISEKDINKYKIMLSNKALKYHNKAKEASGLTQEDLLVFKETLYMLDQIVKLDKNRPNR